MPTQDWGQDDAWGHREFDYAASNLPREEIERRLALVEHDEGRRSMRVVVIIGAVIVLDLLILAAVYWWFQ